MKISNEFIFAVDERNNIQNSVTRSMYKKMKYIGYREQGTYLLIIASPEKVPFLSFLQGWGTDTLQGTFDIRKLGHDDMVTLLLYALDKEIEQQEDMPFLLVKKDVYGVRAINDFVRLYLPKETREKLYELRDNFIEKGIFIYDFKYITEVLKKLKGTKRKLLGLPMLDRVCFISSDDVSYLRIGVRIYGAFEAVEQTFKSYFGDSLVYIKNNNNYYTLYIKPKTVVTLAEALECMDEQLSDYRSVISL